MIFAGTQHANLKLIFSIPPAIAVAFTSGPASIAMFAGTFTGTFLVFYGLLFLIGAGLNRVWPGWWT